MITTDLGMPEDAPGKGWTAALDKHLSDWRRHPPVLTGRGVQLRALQMADAHALLATLTSEAVTRFISTPPHTLEEVEQFIAWTERQRICGTHIVFGVALHGHGSPIGLFQVRRLDRKFELAEWGFVVGAPYWGSGVFEDAASRTLEFVFSALPVRRLEARAAVQNVRGHGALVKMGAVQEAVLRGSLRRNGESVDQVMYSILKEEWQLRVRARRQPESMLVH